VRTQKWLLTREGAAIADIIQEFFPGVPQIRLAAAVDRYKRLGIWGRDPYLPRDGYDRLRGACLSGNIVQTAPIWDQAVDMRLAERAMAENPPALT
jgi:NitT/TauT family transport system substrate-binding protein